MTVPSRSQATPTGYSGTPLAKKLGIKEGFRVFVAAAPGNYLTLLEPLPATVRFVAAIDTSIDIAHVFVMRSAELRRVLHTFRAKLGPAAIVWVSWPKKAAKVQTDITEDTIRALALPLGFVDVKVCAVDETWSGLKLVVRRARR